MNAGEVGPPRHPTVDEHDRQVTALARLWNRSDRECRLEFLEMANDSEGEIIEP